MIRLQSWRLSFQYSKSKCRFDTHWGSKWKLSFSLSSNHCIINFYRNLCRSRVHTKCVHSKCTTKGYLSLLLALSTPQACLAIGLNRALSHKVKQLWITKVINSGFKINNCIWMLLGIKVKIQITHVIHFHDSLCQWHVRIQSIYQNIWIKYYTISTRNTNHAYKMERWRFQPWASS